MADLFQWLPVIIILVSGGNQVFCWEIDGSMDSKEIVIVLFTYFDCWHTKRSKCWKQDSLPVKS